MVSEEKYINSLRYADITRALSRGFFRIFSVNTDTDYFVEYVPHNNDKSLDVRMQGDDFKKVVADWVSVVYYDDLDTVRMALTKVNILKVLSVDTSFILNFRMVQDGKPRYVSLKSTRIRQDDPSHILVALSDTDAHMRRLEKYEDTLKNSLTYASISEALAADYVCIYYVDMVSGEYTEYDSSNQYKTMGFAPSGSDFFKACENEFLQAVYEDDRSVFRRALEKENLERVLSVDKKLILTFRVIMQGEPIYIRLKVSKMLDEDDHHVVIGLSNIDESVKRTAEYEQMRDIANKDALTGVKSKHAFNVAEERINREIEQGKSEPFAVVVFDVNGLKKINDTLGHQAGDEYLRKSCRMICDVFSHSPVYRTGGDEFVALLTGADYEVRNELMRDLHNLSAVHIGTGGSVVSGGMGEFDPYRDHSIQDIFERADEAMYTEKMLLKSLGAVTRDDESDNAEQDTEDIPIINTRKHILIADDERISRDILGELLNSDYDILYASDGVETLEKLREYKDDIAVLLLDLHMPKMNGQDVMREMHLDEDLMYIPVVMLTVDQDAELDSLKLGAMDFISKPYPNMEIVRARIAKCIELSENRDLIRHTQRDKLSSLLNFDYFIRYVERFDHQHKDEAFDAFVCDINRFHSVNEKYGRQFGDLVLHSIGNNIKNLARKTGGIGCRQSGDTFLIYCPHRNDYKQMIEWFKEGLFADKDIEQRISLRFGVFENAGREFDIEKRFARAKAAADSVKNDAEKEIQFL